MESQLGLFPEESVAPAPALVGPAAPTEKVRELAARLPREVRLGTSSWTFPGWDGIVYDRPASAAALSAQGLHAYASHPLLRTVGIDRTFYRPMSASGLREYADAVPEDFRFLVKVDRLVTSPIDPEAGGIRGRNPRFLDAAYAVQEVVGPTLEGLGRKAGPILFQFPPIPPNLVGGRGRFLERLARFLSALPEGPLYAVELRTPSFLNETYTRILEDRAVAHCYNVHPAMSPLARQVDVVQPYYQPALVVRWMLRSGLAYEAARDRYAPFDRIVDEDPTTRERIAVAVLDALVAERSAFVIANNKAEGSAPLTLFELAESIVGWGRPRERADRAP